MTKYYPLIANIGSLVLLVLNAAVNFFKAGIIPDFTTFIPAVIAAYGVIHNTTTIATVTPAK